MQGGSGSVVALSPRHPDVAALERGVSYLLGKAAAEWRLAPGTCGSPNRALYASRPVGGVSWGLAQASLGLEAAL